MPLFDSLVCSDAMARGMDLDKVKYVISYDNPPYIKTYVHRVGRTARAGRAGTAISLLEKKEVRVTGTGAGLLIARRLLPSLLSSHVHASGSHKCHCPTQGQVTVELLLQGGLVWPR